MAGPEEAHGPVDVVLDADAGRYFDVEIGMILPLADAERALGEIGAIMFVLDGEGAGQFAGPVGEAGDESTAIAAPFSHDG